MNLRIAYFFVFIFSMVMDGCIVDNNCTSYQQIEYFGNSLSIIDNSGRKPVKFTGTEIPYSVFGIQYDYAQTPLEDSSGICYEYDNSTPSNVRIITTSSFNNKYPANSTITDAFLFLANSKSTPKKLSISTLNNGCYFILNDTPSSTNMYTFLVKSYRGNLLLEIDTIGPIRLLK